MVYTGSTCFSTKLNLTRSGIIFIVQNNVTSDTIQSASIHVPAQLGDALLNKLSNIVGETKNLILLRSLKFVDAIVCSATNMTKCAFQYSSTEFTHHSFFAAPLQNHKMSRAEYEVYSPAVSTQDPC
jgi:hypothetical protein